MQPGCGPSDPVHRQGRSGQDQPVRGHGRHVRPPGHGKPWLFPRTQPIRSATPLTSRSAPRPRRWPKTSGARKSTSIARSKKTGGPSTTLSTSGCSSRASIRSSPTNWPCCPAWKKSFPCWNSRNTPKTRASTWWSLTARPRPTRPGFWPYRK